MLTLDRVYKAKRVLSEVVRQTDMIRAKNISSQCDVYLKTENLQVTGSFKVRGSYFKISQLSDEEKKKVLSPARQVTTLRVLLLRLPKTESSHLFAYLTAHLSARLRLQSATVPMFAL